MNPRPGDPQPPYRAEMVREGILPEIPPERKRKRMERRLIALHVDPGGTRLPFQRQKP